MKTLLVGINASYMHTCLAVRSIASYCHIPFVEFTINQNVTEILRGIEKEKPDVLMFSVYIWNAEITCKIISDIKKILPKVTVICGGPEISYSAEKYFLLLDELDLVVKGEGERIVKKICDSFKNKTKDEFLQKENLELIKGIYFRNQNKICFTGDEELICSLDELAFAYPELIFQKGEVSPLEKNPFLENKIYYYESSRGCPYSCAYCLSSIDKRIRFMPVERVFADLQIFLDAAVPLVKFVDRTYNLDSKRYLAIWKYIVEHHNKKTMFHFEIEAEYLSDESLEFLQSVPQGVMQFEIGVQSANKKTLRAINRSDNIEKLAENVKRIPRTIHQHLDLIAGLPYEDLESFGKSFDFVMSLKPDELQLGFLKILSGTSMETFAKENGWQWMKNPVYETFSTPYLSYEDTIFLKDVEVLLDAYWNSGVFVHSINYIFRMMNPWKFFESMVLFARNKDVFSAARRETFWFELLNDWLNSKEVENVLLLTKKFSEVLYELLRYDFVLRGKQGGYPLWYEHHYDKEKHRELLEKNGGVKNARLDFAFSEYEVFSYDVDSVEPEKSKGKYEKLIFYKRK